MKPLQLSRVTATSCLGAGLKPLLSALIDERSGLAPCRFERIGLPMYVGEVEGIEQVRLPAEFSSFDCRNNRLAELGLRQDGFIPAVNEAIERWGAGRIGVFIGTSTSGMLHTELAYRQRDPQSGSLPAVFDYTHTHNSFSVSHYVRGRLGLRGPAASVCTACSSSAKAFGSAQRLIAAGLIDAAIVGGVDSLCMTTLFGFHSLQLISPGPCRPFDAARDGLSIGEAAAFALLEQAPRRPGSQQVLLLGVGETSDAYHMSSPHPEGAGALGAMRAALTSAGIQPSDVDYVNLHGTGTLANDRIESRALAELFGAKLPISSTKGATGHTLGAAGALEAVVCTLALQHGFVPAGVGTEIPDPNLTVSYLTETRAQPLTRVVSNSFGFGGANCALLFGLEA